VDGVRHLTIDQVIEFHGEALREFGGLDGIRSPHQVAAAVLMPQQSAFGEDTYSALIAVATLLVNSMGGGREQQAHAPFEVLLPSSTDSIVLPLGVSTAGT
jgi:hypothetical protein